MGDKIDYLFFFMKVQTRATLGLTILYFVIGSILLVTSLSFTIKEESNFKCSECAGDCFHRCLLEYNEGPNWLQRDSIIPSINYFGIFLLLVIAGAFTFIARTHVKEKKQDKTWLHLHVIHFSQLGLRVTFFAIMAVIFSAAWFSDKLIHKDNYDCKYKNITCLDTKSNAKNVVNAAWFSLNWIFFIWSVVEILCFAHKWKNSSSENESPDCERKKSCPDCNKFINNHLPHYHGGKASTNASKMESGDVTHADGNGQRQIAQPESESDEERLISAFQDTSINDSTSGVNGSNAAKENPSLGLLKEDLNFRQELCESLDENNFHDGRRLAYYFGCSVDQVNLFQAGTSAAHDFFVHLAHIRPDITLGDLKEVLEKKLRLQNSKIFKDMKLTAEDLKVSLGKWSEDGQLWLSFQENVVEKLVKNNCHLPTWENVASYYGINNTARFNPNGYRSPTESLFQQLFNREKVPKMSELLTQLKKMNRNDLIRKMDEWLLAEDKRRNDLLRR